MVDTAVVGEGRWALSALTGRPTVVMVVAAFCMSWAPVVVAHVGDVSGPFVFLVWFHVVMSVGWFAYLAAFRPALLRSRAMWGWIVRQLPTRDGARAVVNGVGWAWFVAAAQFVDVAVVTVVTAGLLVLFVAGRSRQASRYAPIGRGGWVLLVAGLVGVGLVTLSEAGIPTAVTGRRVGVGVALSLAAAVSLSWLSFRFKLGTAVWRRVSDGREDPSSELACVLAVSAVTNIPGIAASLLIVGWGFPPVGLSPHPERLFTSEALWIVAAAVAATVGTLAFRHAHLTADTLGVNAVQYLRPALTLGWLVWLTNVTVARPDLLWLGTALVVASNVGLRLHSRALPAGVRPVRVPGPAR